MKIIRDFAAVALLAAGLLLAVPASAETGATAGLDAIRERALARSAAVRKAELAVEAALLSEKGQGLSVLPSLGAQAGASLSASGDPGLSVSAGLQAQEKLYDGGKTALGIKEAALATGEARLALDAAILAVRKSADEAYYAVLLADSNLAGAEADAAASRTALGIAEERLAAGSATRPELLKAQAELAAKETALGQARASRRTAMARLSSLTGLEASASLAAVDLDALGVLVDRVAALDEAASELLVDTILKAAKANDTGLASIGLARSKAAIGESLAKAAYLPSVNAGASVSVGARTGSYGASPSFSVSGSLSVSASISLDVWNVSLAVEKARLAALSPEVEAASRLESLDLEIRTAVYSWLSQAQSVKSAQVAHDYASVSYENSLELYRHQSASQSDLSTAQATLASARRQLDQSRYSFLGSVSTLRTLAGLGADDLLLAMLP